jgi:hypothetical protein
MVRNEYNPEVFQKPKMACYGESGRSRVWKKGPKVAGLPLGDANVLLRCSTTVWRRPFAAIEAQMFQHPLSLCICKIVPPQCYLVSISNLNLHVKR